MNIDSIIHNRSQLRESGNYATSDELRNILIKESVFIIDTKHGQEVYHEKKGTTLKQFEDKIKMDVRANKNFEAWLFTQKQKIKKIENGK